MGDVAMTVPLLLALKNNYPDVRITILTKPHFEPIFYSIKGIRVFSAEVKGKHKGLPGLWKLYRELKGSSITHVADLHNVLRSTILRTFFTLSGIPTAKLDKARSAKKKLTQETSKIFSPLPSTFERYAQTLAQLGFPIDLDRTNVLKRQQLSRETRDFLDKSATKHIGIAPFAAYPSKMYGLHLMETVIKGLLAKRDCQILLFGGGASEVKQLQEIQSKFDGRVICVAGELSFTEELELISNLDVMLAMDSGNGHLAANYGIPVVTIWGVTHPYAGFTPYNQPIENSMLPDRNQYPLIPTSIYGNKFPEGYEEAINTIAPNSIVDKVINVLDRE